ncbi:hypothetical protein Pcinc_002322 [Petrolisthes cinctipes]|uniref:Uncharacterized protein n=1 Tax=Petrolisthes cinctipes TaxID=88211 RepID=A0AAE1GJL0_PETCI|nr:hypothetical protein Pcinc_002322 [Petrolisthes cinctipes]
MPTPPCPPPRSPSTTLVSPDSTHPLPHLLCHSPPSTIYPPSPTSTRITILHTNYSTPQSHIKLVPPPPPSSKLVPPSSPRPRLKRLPPSQPRPCLKRMPPPDTTPTPQALAAPDTTPTPQTRADIAVPAWPQAVAALTPTTTPPLPRYDLRTPATLPRLLRPGITTPTVITPLQHKHSTTPHSYTHSLPTVVVEVPQAVWPSSPELLRKVMA